MRLLKPGDRVAASRLQTFHQDATPLSRRDNYGEISSGANMYDAAGLRRLAAWFRNLADAAATDSFRKKFLSLARQYDDWAVRIKVSKPSASPPDAPPQPLVTRARRKPRR
jgi:hypothetical protein